MTITKEIAAEYLKYMKSCKSKGILYLPITDWYEQRYNK